MKSIRAVLLFSAMAVISLAVVASAAGATEGASSDPSWRLTREEDGIRSYRRLVDGSPLLEFRGEVTIDRDIETVLSVVLDAERVGEWIPRLIESRVLRWEPDHREYIQYTRFDAPWPVADRVFLSRVVLSVDPATRRTEIRYFNTDEGEAELLSKRVGIRGYAGGSYYILEPVADGTGTCLTAVSVADPKGSVPSWLINWVGSSWAHDTMRRLRVHVGRFDVDELPVVNQIYKR